MVGFWAQVLEKKDLNASMNARARVTDTIYCSETFVVVLGLLPRVIVVV